MPGPVSDRLSCVEVFVERYLCQRPFLRWARPHRKARIAKKWRKKYGAVYAPCPGTVVEVCGLGLLMCPCVKAELDRKGAPPGGDFGMELAWLRLAKAGELGGGSPRAATAKTEGKGD